MNGRERLFKVLSGKKADRVPWVPFAGIHAGSLKEYTATEILMDGTKLLECLLEVNRLYTPDGQPILFDLQVEAEILGCRLRWADKAPPSVEIHPCSGSNDIPTQLPGKDDGRLPMILEVMEEMKKQVGSSTALFGLVTGPLTLASHLRGTRFFMDMIKNKDYSKALISYTTEVAKIISGMYIDAGMDVVAIVDPVISQVSPRMFNELLSGSFSQLFARIRDQGRFSSFFVCGDATKNIQPMCNTKPGSIFVDENVNMHAAKKITDANGIILGGNIPLTSVMLYGTQQDNMKYVIDLIDEIGRKHLIIAPGCDMPYDIPPANVVGVVQALAEPRKVRKMLEDYHVEEMDIDVSLPDYSKLDHLLIEVFTIDSATCPACGYMKSTAMTATGEFGDAVRITERKWTDRENIAIAKKLGIKHLPCMLFNGKIQYSSLIPSKEEYFKDIHEFLSRMDEKGE